MLLQVTASSWITTVPYKAKHLQRFLFLLCLFNFFLVCFWIIYNCFKWYLKQVEELSFSFSMHNDHFYLVALCHSSCEKELKCRTPTVVYTHIFIGIIQHTVLVRVAWLIDCSNRVTSIKASALIIYSSRTIRHHLLLLLLIVW